RRHTRSKRDWSSDVCSSDLYFAEQRRFHLSLQAQRVSFDQFLQVRGQTVEQFRAELHADAERKLRSRLGLLLVADKENLQPTPAEVDAALAAWEIGRAHV